MNRAIVIAASSGSAPALYAKPSADFGQREQDALATLRAAAQEFAGRIVQATSLGAEDMVLTDLIARHALPIAIATLDTGMLHGETLELLARAQRHYDLEIEAWRPDADAARDFVARHGPQAMRTSVDLRHACCALRKLEPLSRMLQGRAAWVTGLRREQSPARGQVAGREADAQGRIKLSPLLDWTQGDVWHYIALHAVPYNPLHDQFFPSIGCAPCTRAVALGEDIRAGRWWWEQEGAKECGLHVEQRPGDRDPHDSPHAIAADGPTTKPIAQPTIATEPAGARA
ncbi:MAG: phosphoadenylyl-sulfate reductase [Burkholderiales bacterium]|jgi:phosphoadenosine phosphosulfate reductase|nr:phosphoadenylyl-sulfate reductase [Burkholderiales bacterium]